MNTSIGAIYHFSRVRHSLLTSPDPNPDPESESEDEKSISMSGLSLHPGISNNLAIHFFSSPSSYNLEPEPDPEPGMVERKTLATSPEYENGIGTGWQTPERRVNPTENSSLRSRSLGIHRDPDSGEGQVGVKVVQRRVVSRAVVWVVWRRERRGRICSICVRLEVRIDIRDDGGRAYCCPVHGVGGGVWNTCCTQL
ncbi:hypothetical protein BJX99DRAFT_221850 [Aspergillus californicus]